MKRDKYTSSDELADIIRGMGFGGGWSPGGYLWEEGGLGQRSAEGKLYSEHPELYKRDIPVALEEWYGEKPARKPVTSRGGMRSEEKTLSEELADVLRRPEVKMLTAPERAKLITEIQKTQAAIATQEQAREKHETEMMAIGRETQQQERIQAILQSDRVPAQKAIALWMIGVPQLEADEMVWGKRAPEEEARPTREVAPRATPEELAAALRPEPKGVQFRMIGGELFKEPAGIWEKRYTPEERIAERRAAEERHEARRTERIEAEEAERTRMADIYERRREVAKTTREAELAKEEEKAKERQERIDHIDSLGREMKTAKEEKEQKKLEKIQEKWEKTRKTIKDEIEKDEERKEAERIVKEEKIKEVDELGRELADEREKRKIAKIKYDDEKKKIEREYRDSVIAKGEKKAKDARDYKVTVLEKTFNWMKMFDDLGFDNEDLIEVIPEFLGTLDINKEQEEGIMKAFDVVGEIAKRNEEEVIADFKTCLKEQCQSIDGEVVREGITEETENKIEWLAFLQWGLDEKVLGHDAAMKKWEGIVKTGYWWAGGDEIPLKKVEAKEVFREKMKSVIAKAKTTDIMNVAGKLLSEENQKRAEKIAGQFAKEKGREIELPEGLKTALVGLGDKDSNYVTETYESLFNAKTGKMTKEPSATDRQRALGFVVGVRDDKRFKGVTPDEKEKALLPVNMTGTEFLEALIQESKLSRTQEGWLIWKRFEPALWEGLQNEASLLGHLIMSKSEEGERDGILDKIERGLRGVFEEKPETHWFFKPAEKVLGKVQRWWEGKEKTKPTSKELADILKRPTPEGKDIRQDLREIVKDHPGIKGREAAIYLKEKGWSDEEIRALGGAR